MARKISDEDKKTAKMLFNGKISITEAAKAFGVKTRNDAYRTAVRAFQKMKSSDQG